MSLTPESKKRNLWEELQEYIGITPEDLEQFNANETKTKYERVHKRQK